MTTFNQFKDAVCKKLDLMYKSGELYTTTVTGDMLWETYLKSFPAGTNETYRSRAEHDCSACKSFIRNIGNVVALDKDKLTSMWDIQVSGEYQVVANALHAQVMSSTIDTVYRSKERKIGTKENHEIADGNIVKTWEHFYTVLPFHLMAIGYSVESIQGENRTKFATLTRALNELSIEALDITLELIKDGALYRGTEFKRNVDEFLKLKKEYDKAKNQTVFVWTKLGANCHLASFKNSVIGTLVSDLATGKDVEYAVSSFESKVAPQNYQRPKALVTARMVADAESTVKDLEIEESLYRRFSTVEDITINNLIFADRTTKTAMGIFDAVPTTATKLPAREKIKDIDIESFIASVVPTATKIEVYFDNVHKNNMVSLISPKYAGAPNILKWSNNFSWSYHGEVTDSIKERVKAAGGAVDGDMRVSLSWFNFDDLDLSVVEPSGNVIDFRQKKSLKTGGFLDVDMNAGMGKSRNAVENIAWMEHRRMQEGKYIVKVTNFSLRETKDTGFVLEMEYLGKTVTITKDNSPKNRTTDVVAEFEYSNKDGVSFNDSESGQKTLSVWGIDTCKFHTVNAMMLSPNHWDDNEVGQKHVFFMLANCINDQSARGFYNEFLSSDLNKHRKVFELLAGKMKPEITENQLSGLGFSTTQRNDVIVRVSGKTSRLFNVKF
ncbi:hypothetical protein [Alishewanella phage vB_AspM_Slickus01]|nr:hypothetical protein [Alishewanella phage vB_AspM_Slickus01]